MNTINNYDIKLLAEEFGTPIYVYDKDQIESNYRNLKSSFVKYYPNTSVHFSVKANSNLHILKIFKEIGCGADTASPFELLLAKEAGISNSKILYTGNYESLEDWKELALHQDITINLDDISSLDRMLKVFKPKRISFRINPGIGRGGFEGITTGGADAKFGVPYEKAIDAYQKAIDAGIERFGIHMMAGSNNLEPYYFYEVVDKLMKITGNLFGQIGAKPEFIDIGGGFGVPYDDEEEPLNIDFTAKLIGEVIAEKADKFKLGTPELKLEPGRYLVANAGYLVSKVTGVKKSYKTFVGVDAGINTLIRPALYGAKHRSYIYGKDAPNNFYNICGQICENSDILDQHVYLPDTEEGDLLIFRDAGAYGYVMSSNYNNRPRPAEVMIESGKPKQIRRRETYEDMLRLY